MQFCNGNLFLIGDHRFMFINESLVFDLNTFKRSQGEERPKKRKETLNV